MPHHKKHLNPTPGTSYTKKYKGKAYTMRVVKEGGRVGYSVGGVTYKTPTAAATSVSTSPTNGWTFWGITQTAPSTPKGRPWSVTVRRA